jgi:hypothetical protein
MLIGVMAIASWLLSTQCEDGTLQYTRYLSDDGMSIITSDCLLWVAIIVYPTTCICM